MMNNLKMIAILVLSALFFNQCSHKNAVVGFEGLWISTEESSHLFEPGAEELALQIGRDSSHLLTASGFFLNNNELKFDSEFTHVQYDRRNQRISMLDPDSDTLILHLDTKDDRLEGAYHLQDGTRIPLDFVRAGRNLEVRLFHPRVPDENGQIAYHYHVPEQTGDGLKTASIYRYIKDSVSFTNLMKDIIDQEYGHLKSLLIFKDNRLVAEEYFFGYNRNETQQLRSCTKSVTSILLGIALDRHEEVHMDQSIYTFFPEYDSLKTEGRGKITLEHVLTMFTGFQWDDIPPGMFTADDCIQYILSRPLEAEPGTKFNYNSGCSILLGGVISYLEHISTREFAENALFTPLGITDYIWETHKDGTLQCGSGLSLRPRDMAKIGLLVLNDGRWKNEQVVSTEWIRESTRPHVHESVYFDYGYQWWHHSKNTVQWWKEPNRVSPEEHDLITALGHGGQYIMIIRDLNLVVVTTATDFENGHVARSKIPMVIEEIIPIFEDESSQAGHYKGL